jgi:hypothetical protein
VRRNSSDLHARLEELIRQTHAAAVANGDEQEVDRSPAELAFGTACSTKPDVAAFFKLP